MILVVCVHQSMWTRQETVLKNAIAIVIVMRGINVVQTVVVILVNELDLELNVSSIMYIEISSILRYVKIYFESVTICKAIMIIH